MGIHQRTIIVSYHTTNPIYTMDIVRTTIDTPRAILRGANRMFGKKFTKSNATLRLEGRATPTVEKPFIWDVWDGEAGEGAPAMTIKVYYVDERMSVRQAIDKMIEIGRYLDSITQKKE